MGHRHGSSISSGDRKSSFSLIATLKSKLESLVAYDGTLTQSPDLEVVAKFEGKHLRARYDRSVIVSVDEGDRWESNKRSLGSRLLWEEDREL